MKKITQGLIVSVLAFGVFSLVAMAKNDKEPNEKSNNENSQKLADQVVDASGNGTAKSNQEKTKTKNVREDQQIKNSNEENETDEDINGKGNSSKKSDDLKGNSDKISKSLKKVAVEEVEVGEELENLAEDQEETQNEIDEAVKKIKKQTKTKSFLIGTDYKNLGQLRSQMVQNRNQIRQLTQLINKVEGEDNKLVLKEQLEIMMQEREKTTALIKSEEDSFSLFGWAFRLINGQPKDSVDEVAETELKAEVTELLEELEESSEIEEETSKVEIEVDDSPEEEIK